MKPSRSKKGKAASGPGARDADAPKQPEQAAAPADMETGTQRSRPPVASTPERDPSHKPSGSAGPGLSRQTKRSRDKPNDSTVGTGDDVPLERKQVTERKPVTKEAQETQAQDVQQAPAARSRFSAELIAQRAYALYEAGGYQQGKEVEHWLEAERQLDAEARSRNS